MKISQKSKGVQTLKIIEKIIDTVFILFCACITALSIYTIYDASLIKESTDFSSLADEVVIQDEQGNISEVDLESLRQQNNEIVGWIKIDNTDISFPILHNKDNNFYLNHDYLKNYSTAGSIFLDMYNSTDFSDDYNIIYGHNLNENGMFGTLNLYTGEQFTKEHSTGKLFTTNGDYNLSLISYAETTKDNRKIYEPSVYKNEHNEDIYEAIKNITIFQGTTEHDKILALSTCLNNSGDRRLLFFRMSQ